jgi:thiol:disulfide interchange protein
MRVSLFAVTVIALAGCATSAPKAGKNVAPVGAEFTVVDIDPRDGTYAEQMRVNYARADSLGQMPYLELGAPWCGPCRLVAKSLGDSAVMHALRGTYLMRFDIDRWQPVNRDSLARVIPVIIALDRRGAWTNRRLVGAPPTSHEIAEAFEPFFHQVDGTPDSVAARLRN